MADCARRRAHDRHILRLPVGCRENLPRWDSHVWQEIQTERDREVGEIFVRMPLRNCWAFNVAKSSMRLSVQYVNDAQGKVQAVQVPVGEWKRLLKSMRSLEQRQKLKADLTEALAEVTRKRASNQKMETLDEFLRGL